MNPVTRNEGMKELMSSYADKATTKEEKDKFLKMEEGYNETSSIFKNFFMGAKLFQLGLNTAGAPNAGAGPENEAVLLPSAGNSGENNTPKRSQQVTPMEFIIQRFLPPGIYQPKTDSQPTEQKQDDVK